MNQKYKLIYGLIFFLIILGCVAWIVIGYIIEINKCCRLENEVTDLKRGITQAIKELKVKIPVTIHYGKEKQLTFIEGKLQ